MDKAQAILFANDLIAHGSVAEWKVSRLIGYGKSAVILAAEGLDGPGAVKVFHPEIVERFGLESQQIRIERERSLIGKNHPHLVEIIGGGVCPTLQYPFIAMRLVEGQPLTDVLNEVERDDIVVLIEQLARAAKFLEDMGVVHRDIKPDNIFISSNLKFITLLDFGVMKPIGDSSATDQPGHRPFLGTHQYSPPEMLHRREDDSVEGWRAITFYQIGAVLHDLVMRRRIFEEHQEPYADLVVAIDTIEPRIAADDVQPLLLSLARKCLLKRPEDRLKLVNWDDFFFSTHVTPVSLAERKAHLLKLRNEGATRDDGLARVEALRLAGRGVARAQNALRRVVDDCLDEIADIVPLRKITPFAGVHPEVTIHCDFQQDKRLGFATPFNIQASLALDEGSSLATIYVRAGKGETGEMGWTKLGEFLEDFSGATEALSVWVMSILEELIVDQGEKA